MIPRELHPQARRKLREKNYSKDYSWRCAEDGSVSGSTSLKVYSQTPPPQKQTIWKVYEEKSLLSKHKYKAADKTMKQKQIFMATRTGFRVIRRMMNTTVKYGRGSVKSGLCFSSKAKGFFQQVNGPKIHTCTKLPEV